MCRALFTCGQRGQVRLVESLNMFLIIKGACSVFHNDTFCLKGDIG